MTHIYFVRHAEPNHSWEDDRTRPLTDEGLSDANKLIEFFKSINIDSFISSPYKRSFDTILPTADYMNKKIKVDERLRERKAGINSNNKEYFYKRWKNKKFAEENGECIELVQKRNIEALNEILKNKIDQTVVVGTHGTALSSIINYFQPKFGCDDFLRIINYMPYIIKMEFDKSVFIKMEEKIYFEKKYKEIVNKKLKKS